MKLVVTGGAGFIGANFVRYMAEKYPTYEIVVIDKLTYAGNPKNIADVKAELVKLDICSPQVKEHLKSADYVAHFAAESHVTRSESEPELFYKTNVDGTDNLLKACSSQLKKFVHISTDEVYGDAKDGQFFKENEKLVGDDQATSDYAKSKAQADDLAISYGDKLPINVVRPTNNFGYYQFPEKMLPRQITRVLSHQPIALWGEGNQIRDWLYAEDTARAVDLIMHKAPAGEVYNVGANNDPEIKNRDLVFWLCGYLHELEPTIEFQKDVRQHHDFRYGVDNSKITELGWQPSAQAWQQFADTVEWYKKNKDWWQPLIVEAEKIY